MTDASPATLTSSPDPAPAGPRLDRHLEQLPPERLGRLPLRSQDSDQHIVVAGDLHDRPAARREARQHLREGAIPRRLYDAGAVLQGAHPH
jgi:hypothetical protein